MPKPLISEVPGFEGPCKPTYLSNGPLSRKIFGITGFFRNVKKYWLIGWVKTGKEFHGYITSRGTVKSTYEIYSTHQME